MCMVRFRELQMVFSRICAAIALVTAAGLFFSGAFAENADTIRSLSINFKRVYSENKRVDSVKGRFFYSADGSLFVNTTEPVRQFMRVEGNSMLLYYPDSRRAFRIVQSRPFTMPFIQSLVWTFNRKSNLEKAGFRFDHAETAGDTAREYWKAPRQIAKQIRHLRISVVNRRTVVSIETFNAEGRCVVTTACGSYGEAGGVPIPLTMTTSGTQGGLPYTESVVFGDPRINREDDLAGVFFSIPPDVKIEEKRL